MSDLNVYGRTDANLAAWLRFRERTNLGLDSSPLAIPWPTSHGTPDHSTVGHPRFGIDLTRTSSTVGEGILVPNASAPRLSVSSGSFSVGAWVKTDILAADTTDNKHIMAKWEDTGGGQQWRLMLLGSTDEFLLEWSTNGTNSFSCGTGSTTTATTSSFFHVVAVYDRGNSRARTFVNGVEEDEQTSNIADLSSETTDITLGYCFEGVNQRQFWDGIISEAFFMDKALTNDEVATLYRYGIRDSVYSGYAMSLHGPHDWASRYQSDGSELILS